MDNKDYAKTAEELFKNGCNCSQAVLLAFSDKTGLDEETSLKLASSFGGGMGRMREVCGAVSGALMVLGIVKGYSDLSDANAKKEHYALVQEFARLFKEENGSIICRELLSGVNATEGGVPEERTETYYRKRPCSELCFTAAKITEELLK